MEMPSDEVITAFCPILCGEAKAPSQAALMIFITHTFTPNTRTHTRFLCSGCGKHGKRNSLIVVGLGHPLRCLAVASCGSNAAKKTAETYLPSTHSCQNQQIVKSAQPLVALDMTNNDEFTMATIKSRSNEQAYRK